MADKRRKLADTSFDKSKKMADSPKNIRRQSSLPNIPASIGPAINLNDLVTKLFSSEPFVNNITPVLEKTLIPSIEKSLQRSIEKIIENIMPKIMESCVSLIESKILNYESNINELSSDITLLNEKVVAQEFEIAELKTKLDEGEQYSRRNCLRVHGVKLENGQSSDSKIIAIANNDLGVNLALTDIDRSHPIGAKSQDGKIQLIVRFTSYRARDLVYRARTKLKNNSEKIFISEDLTKPRHRLVKLLLDKRKSGHIHNVWSYDGRIFFRKAPDSKPVLVKSIDDIAKI